MMNETSRLLALETTDLTGSVALCEKGEVLGVRPLDPEQRSARSLAPAIQSILREFSWKPADVDVVAAVVGPSSFTALRVGIATAKMFAWSVGAQIVGVDALDAIVNDIYKKTSNSNLSSGLGTLVSVGIDAQRGDAAFRNYWVAPSDEQPELKIFSLNGRFKILSCKKWLDSSQPIILDEAGAQFEESTSVFSSADQSVFELAERYPREMVLYTGPVLARIRNRESLYSDALFAEPAAWNPSAADVARIAWMRVLRKSFDNPFSILPIYSRKAAAEEKALEKAAARGALK
jgi:tRNA threonylcarbamoyladenosine biosynthesis protein TsaB